MRVAIGSLNKIKVAALWGVIGNALSVYEFFTKVEIVSLAIPSGVSEQPMSMEETAQGAKNRAISAYQGYDLGIGLESGLIETPGIGSGMMDCCYCVIYDGEYFGYGISPGFEIPPKVLRFIQEENLNLDEAFFKAGLTKNRKIGSAEGAIGFLTRGRITRQGYTEQAIMTALIPFENPELYRD